MKSSQRPADVQGIVGNREAVLFGFGISARKLFSVVALSTAMIMGAGAVAWSQDVPVSSLPAACEAAATQKLAALNLSNGAKRAQSSIQATGVQVPGGYVARYTVPSCGGTVVMRFDSGCQLFNVYTQGACHVDGLTNW